MNPFKHIISTSLICAMLVTGCGAEGAKGQAQTPEDAIQTALTALRELDMETFNACTNNRKGDKYLLFGDLLKDKGRAYLPLAETMVANLSWEINSIEETGDTAIANVTIHNKDFSNAVGDYIADMIRYVEEQHRLGADISLLIDNIIDEALHNPELLLPYLEACTEEFSADITINLSRVDDTWQIHLTDSLCETLIGYAGFDNFTEDIEPLIKAAEEFFNNNLKRWGIDLEQNAGQWLNQIGEKVNNLLIDTKENLNNNKHVQKTKVGILCFSTSATKRIQEINANLMQKK